MLSRVLRILLSTESIKSLRNLRQRYYLARKRFLPVFTEQEFQEILQGPLGVENGDTLFVHSSVDRLNLGFPFYRLLSILRESVGERGNLLFPTDSSDSSLGFLRDKTVFDIRRTPSSTGILTEFARRQKLARRSLHPTKSVCAIGPDAEFLVAEHYQAPRPYGNRSPYYRIIQLKGKIIGLGVTTRNLSFVHCVEDLLAEKFPVATYLEEIFSAECLDREGKPTEVRTYAHNPAKMIHNIPGYISKHVMPSICQDIKINRQSFFRAEAGPLLERMAELAESGVTIYPKSLS